jgi:hypothetical protein
MAGPNEVFDDQALLQQANQLIAQNAILGGALTSFGYNNQPVIDALKFGISPEVIASYIKNNNAKGLTDIVGGAKQAYGQPSGYVADQGGDTAGPRLTASQGATDPTAPKPTGAGHYVAAPGTNGKSYWVNANGDIALDANGAPALYDLQDATGRAEAGANSRAAMQEAGANSRQAAQIASNEKLAAESNRIAEDQFNQKFARDNFTSDRAYQQAKEQFIATFNQSENQFGATQAGLDRRAANAEQGVNDRFGAQMNFDVAKSQNEYGLSSANSQNQYNLSAYETETADTLNRYKAGTDRQARLSELATQRERDTRDILSKPSDALARLFFQRDGQSPVAFTSQADLIDRLNAQIKGSIPAELPAAIARPAYVAPPAFITPQAYVPRPQLSAAPYTPTPAGGSVAPASAPVNTGSSGPNGSAGGNLSVVNGNAVWTPSAMAQGGVTREPVLRVGDSPSGKPNDTEETVINPTGAPIAVVPNEANSKLSPQDDEETTRLKKKTDGIRKLMQHVETPRLLHMLVDELTTSEGRLSPRRPAKADGGTRSGNLGYLDGEPQPENPDDTLWWRRDPNAIPRFYLGTLDLNNLNGLDTPTDRAQLQQDAIASTSPGGQALLSDTPVADLRFGGGEGGQLPLPSAQRFNRLTGAERDNLNTSLAARYNTNLDDLTDQLSQRYGGTRTRAQARLTVR